MINHPVSMPALAARRISVWTLAEHAGEPTPDGMQHLLAARCGTKTACAMTCAPTWSEHLGDPGAVLVVAVLLAYASGAGHAVIDRELYLPRSWIRDPQRCRAAASPARCGLRPGRPWPGGCACHYDDKPADRKRLGSRRHARLRYSAK
jgi:hypothetical protein